MPLTAWSTSSCADPDDAGTSSARSEPQLVAASLWCVRMGKMKMPKATDADKIRFRSLVDSISGVSGVEVKPMFGQLGAFVNGNMFAGLFGSTIGVKLDEDATAELRGIGGGLFGPEERPRGGYTTIPDTADAETWAERAAVHVASFPPKTKRS
jgi:TfoX/Sxy family transcriptional regulator of competence genes